MRVLVLGGSGMLGHDVCALLTASGFEVAAPSSAELDLRNPPPADFSDGFDWVVNCAAYTAVDQAETDREAATILNEAAPFLLGDALSSASRMIHISTDYVFDGTKHGPYVETDPVAPLGVYGRSKAAGEKSVLGVRPDSVVMRTAWLYGAYGKCFPKAILNRWLAGGTLRVVQDQVGCPTYTGELARAILSVILSAPEGGIYHAAGPESMSWYDFALEVLHAYDKLRPAGMEIQIEPIQTEDWPTPAARPKNSILDSSKLKRATGFELEPATKSLIKFCEQI